MTWQWPKLPKMVSVIKDTIVIYCFCKNWHETAQEHPLFKRLPVSLKQIESFLHFSSKTIENFSNSNCDPSMFQLPARRFAPCIMCVQYRGGCSVPWGISWVPWGDIMINVGDILSTVGGVRTVGVSWVPWGDILSTVGDVQYRGGYHDARGGYHEYRGGCSVPWGDIILWNLSTVGGYHDTCGGYHEYHGGCSVPWGTQITKDFPPTVLNTLHGTHGILPRYSWYPPRYSRYPPHLSWYPPRYWTPPWYSRYPPTVLKISPHGTHDIPHGTEHPPWYWAPPTVLHTHYTGWFVGIYDKKSLGL